MCVNVGALARVSCSSTGSHRHGLRAFVDSSIWNTVFWTEFQEGWCYYQLLAFFLKMPISALMGHSLLSTRNLASNGTGQFPTTCSSGMLPCLLQHCGTSSFPQLNWKFIWATQGPTIPHQRSCPRAPGFSLSFFDLPMPPACNWYWQLLSYLRGAFTFPICFLPKVPKLFAISFFPFCESREIQHFKK